MFSITLWFYDQYTMYAICILLTSIISLTTQLIDVKSNLNNLKRMIDYECKMTVKRVDLEGKTVFKEISSNDLVPGDIIVVPERIKMP